MAGALAGALARVTRVPVTLTCAGRTDSGVHATRPGGPFRPPCRSVRRPRSGCSGQVVQQPAGLRRWWYGMRRSPRPGSTPAARRSPVATGTWWSTRRWPIRCWPSLTWQVADPLDLRTMAAGCRRLARRARLPGLLPAGAGIHAGRCHQPPGDRRPVDPAERPPPTGGGQAGRAGARPGTLPGPGPPGGDPLRLRDRGQRLLPPDGPLPGRHPGRRGTGSQATLRHALASSVRPTASRPPSRLPPRASP